MGDDGIDTVISHIDMKYLITLVRPCGTDGDTMSIEGTDGAMELGTMPVSGVQVNIAISGRVLTVCS
jgi:hypothetical protein